MNKNIGFIGCGNMGLAMVQGIIQKKFTSPKQLIVSTKSPTPRDEITALGVHFTNDNNEVVKNADIVFLAVKPHLYQEVIKSLDKTLFHDKIFVSIAAGISIAFLEEHLGKNVKILRTMPNTPAMVGAGVTALCPNKNITQRELEVLTEMLSCLGLVVPVKEEQFDSIVALCGSSPAYMFLVLEAMADAAVLTGLNRQTAYQLAAQSMLGSARLLLDSKKHPAQLKDMVTSPAGTTIEAVRVLEEKGLRSAIIEGMIACYEKSKSM